MCLIMINVCIILFYIIKRKYVQVQGMFDIVFICHSVFNIVMQVLCRLSRFVYTYERVVMYDIILTG